MLEDIVNIFSKIYYEKGETYITDTYSLGEGTYIYVNHKGIIERILDVNKKNKDETNLDYKFFRQLDYLSGLIDMNKPIDKFKIIHSNNYMSFFIKKENISNGKLKDEMIDGYYEILLDPKIKYAKDKKKAIMYESVESNYEKVNEEKLNNIKQWIKCNIYSILETENITEDKNYLKIFFEGDLKEYKNENEKYLIPNIFNSTDYNVVVNGTVLGLPNDNMKLNSKKPFLKNKSRKNETPCLVNVEQALMQKKFFDYLENKAHSKEYNIYIRDGYIGDIRKDGLNDSEFFGYYIRIKKSKEVEIHEFDTITQYSDNITPIYIDNTLDIKYPDEYKMMYYGEISKLKDLESLIDTLYFGKSLMRNYFTESKDIKVIQPKLKFHILNSRKAFFDWFYKGRTESIKSIFYKMSIDIIKNTIKNNYFMRAKEQFNLMLSIVDYLQIGGNKLSDIMEELSSTLSGKINSDFTQPIETDEEYYFAVGQALSYLLSLSKSGTNKNHSLINPVLSNTKDEKLKTELNKLFKKYNYIINKGNKRFNNLYSMIMGYVPESKIKDDILISGYLHSNLIYELKKGE